MTIYSNQTISNMSDKKLIHRYTARQNIKYSYSKQLY